MNLDRELIEDIKEITKPLTEEDKDKLRAAPKFATIKPPRNGFQITFKNGYTVSIVWGNATYSEARMKDIADEDKFFSANAEVAIIRPDGEFLPFKLEGGEITFLNPDSNAEFDVAGWVSPDVVATIIREVSWR